MVLTQFIPEYVNMIRAFKKKIIDFYSYMYINY